MLGVLSLVATDFAGMALPWLIKEGIDSVLNKGAPMPSPFKYPLLLLAAAAVQGLFRYCWRINIHGFSRRCEAELRDRVFAHLQKLPVSYFQHTKTGDLMSRLTNDIHAVRELMGFGSLAIVDALVVLVFSLGLMIAIDPWLTLWSMLAMPTITVVVRFFGRHIFRWSRDTQEQLSVMSAYVQENLSGIRVVQAYAQEQNQIQGFDTISTDYRRKTMWLATLWGIFWPLMQVLAGIAATIVLWLGGRQVMQGTMTLGEFVAFNGYLAMLTWPLMAIGYTVNQYQRGTAALSRLCEVLDVPVSPRYLTESSPVSLAGDGAIEFRNLTFAHGAAHAPVLKNISLKIPAGKICGIVGETGSGKSTLVSLLLRLHEPPDQSVFVDGVDIKRLPVHRLEAAVGYVSQDIFLFSGTVQENILFGAANGESKNVEEAARIAQLLPTIRSFSAQFDTVIGERGVRLSGGQKQRTALARAIIKNPPILILDDAFSSVDVETEEEILRELRQFMKGRTTLLISHRISTVREADMIVYLRSGAVIEQGGHEELLARRGPYYQLFQRQRLVREVEVMSHEEQRP
ncbi:MAG: ABC transporter ATP-binding protein [Deltaproteobacteria bacterium]|nr:ABC transporter ATP-binding protein [Deltaproteobacteria bacterium]